MIVVLIISVAHLLMQIFLLIILLRELVLMYRETKNELIKT